MHNFHAILSILKLNSIDFWVTQSFCEETLDFFKVSMCVDFVLYCGETLDLFRSSPVCDPGAGDIDYLKEEKSYRNFPLYWRDCFFQVKNPCAGDFSPVVEH